MRICTRNFCRSAVAGFVLVAAFSMSSSAQDGAATFKAKCAMCHGPDGKGDTSVGKSMGVHDFTSAAVQGQSDTDLTQTITKGKGKMPAYGSKLSDAQIKDLVAYIRTLGKGK